MTASSGSGQEGLLCRTWALAEEREPPAAGPKALAMSIAAACTSKSLAAPAGSLGLSRLHSEGGHSRD